MERGQDATKLHSTHSNVIVLAISWPGCFRQCLTPWTPKRIFLTACNFRGIVFHLPAWQHPAEGERASEVPRKTEHVEPTTVFHSLRLLSRIYLACGIAVGLAVLAALLHGDVARALAAQIRRLASKDVWLFGDLLCLAVSQFRVRVAHEFTSIRRETRLNASPLTLSNASIAWSVFRNAAKFFSSTAIFLGRTPLPRKPMSRAMRQRITRRSRQHSASAHLASAAASELRIRCPITLLTRTSPCFWYLGSRKLCSFLVPGTRRVF